MLKFYGMAPPVFRSVPALPACFLYLVLFFAAAAPGDAQQPVAYRVAFPAPEHHYAEVEVTFPGLGQETLEARMSRSSPGRYALHEYSKNVFDVRAFDGAGRCLSGC